MGSDSSGRGGFALGNSVRASVRFPWTLTVYVPRRCVLLIDGAGESANIGERESVCEAMWRGLRQLNTSLSIKIPRLT